MSFFVIYLRCIERFYFSLAAISILYAIWNSTKTNVINIAKNQPLHYKKEAIYLCIKDVPKCHLELMVKCSAVIGTRLHYLNKKNPNKLNLLVRKLAHGYLLTSTFRCKWKKGGFSKPFNVHAIFLFFLKLYHKVTKYLLIYLTFQCTVKIWDSSKNLYKKPSKSNFHNPA